MLAKKYLVIGRADHSGGSLSHGMNISVFKEQNYATKVISLSTTWCTLRSYFRGADLCLISPRHDNSIKDLIKMKINYYIFTKKCVQLSSTIVDGALPLTCKDISKLKLFASVIRSTPKCFAWTSNPQKQMPFIEQIKASRNIICASRSEAQVWKERINDFHKPVIQYLTPMEIDSSSTVIDLGYSEPFLLISVGNIGPRKGIELFLNLLDQKGKRCKVLVLGKGFLPVDKYINLEVDVKYDKINLCHSVSNAVRVFPSHSECFSRAQFEGILSGDPCLIFQSGSDPDINKFLAPSDICATMEELVDRSLNHLDHFGKLVKRNTENAAKYYHQTQAEALRIIANQ